MIRLFIALSIQPEVKTNLDTIITDLKSKGGKVKYVNPNNIHLTIKFLGNTEESKVDRIISQLDNAANNISPILSNLTKLGGFPNLKNPRVIWVDIEKNREQIINLGKTVDTALTEIGFDKDTKPFTPHLTLGRVKDNNGLNSLTDFIQQYKFNEIPLLFNSLSLIQSTLTQKGPYYKTLHKINFTERFGG